VRVASVFILLAESLAEESDWVRRFEYRLLDEVIWVVNNGMSWNNNQVAGLIRIIGYKCDSRACRRACKLLSDSLDGLGC